MPGLVVGIILIWVLTSVVLGLMMILVLRRHESQAPHVQSVQPRLVSPALITLRGRGHAGAACEQRARHRRIPRLGR